MGKETLADAKCCLCIPIETGMKIMAILSMIGGCFCILGAVMTILQSIVAGIFFLIFCAWPLYVAFVWYKWFKEDTSENTQKVMCVMKCQFIVACVLVGLMFVLAIMAIAEQGIGVIIPVIINGAIQLFFGWYYWNVTKRYHSLRHETFA